MQTSRINTAKESVGVITENTADDESNEAMLISKSASAVEVMTLALTCAKLMIAIEGSKDGEVILQQLTIWSSQVSS